MPDRIYITGVGIISSIGKNADENFDALCALRSGIEPMRYLSSNYRNRLLSGEVKATNEELKYLAEVRQELTFSRTSLLGMIAAKQALQNAGIRDINEKRTGLVSATTVGGMDRGEIFYADFKKGPGKGRLRNIIGQDCGDSTEKIADYLSIKEHITTISTACSSSANAIMYGARLIKNGVVDRVIAGGTDAMSKFTVNGFRSLNILSDGICKPFDHRRNGLNLGEGAGYIVLESEASVIASKKTPLCELKGYGNSCDAYHQTASSPEGYGAWLAMGKAIAGSGMDIANVDYINAHGTGTINNDFSEGAALKKLFKDAIPPFGSTKGYTGHTLGAAGGIEAVISVMSIMYGIIFPSLCFSEPMPELNIEPGIKLQINKNIRNVLSNSFGFGGNNTSLLFSKC